MAKLAHEMTLIKKFKKEIKKLKILLRNESKTNIMDILGLILINQRPHIQKSFS